MLKCSIDCTPKLKHLKVNVWLLELLEPVSASLLSVNQPLINLFRPTHYTGHPCLSCDVGFIRNVLVTAISIINMLKMTSSIIICIVMILKMIISPMMTKTIRMI